MLLDQEKLRELKDSLSEKPSTNETPSKDSERKVIEEKSV
jgi:hypothetical protein